MIDDRIVLLICHMTHW